MSTTSTTVRPPCPAWCEYTAEDHARDDSPHLIDPALHMARPAPGFQVWQLHGRELTATMNETISNDTDLTPAQLRELAAGALAAAEWIEARS